MVLKDNSKRILDIVATQTEQNATEAYRQIHPNAKDITARVNAYKLMQKPEAQLYLQQHIDRAKATKLRVLDLADKKQDSVQWQRLGNEVAEQVLDRALGKATQRIEQQSTSVNLNIDLTSISDNIVDSDTSDTP